MDREQAFLLPPDMREWLPGDHLVWFVLDVVAGFDLAGFRGARRLGGAGRAAYHPRMMVALLVYGYALGQRSSRQIERLCQVDVAFRIVCAQDVPDHATIARFRAEHERALGELFEQVLLICARAGMGRLGTVALDGTKIAANASLGANRGESTLRRMAEQMLGEAAQIDAAEDAQFGAQQRGDELPGQLADPAGRAARLKTMLEQIAAERAERVAGSELVKRAEARVERARGKLADTRAEVERRNAERARCEQLLRAEGGRGLPGRAVPVGEHYHVRQATARLAAAQTALSRARQAAAPPAGQPGEVKRNLTDPDSRIMKTRHGWIQGYNGQLLVCADYLILAAELTNEAADVGHYQPMLATTQATITGINAATGADWAIGTALADAGYASNDNLTAHGPDRLIALGTRRDLDNAAATTPTRGDPPEHATARQRMHHRLRTPDGAALYRQRAAIVEPVNAHLKDRRALRRFARRGLTAARSEFRFAAAVTNLLRLRTTAPAPAS